ncbi:MAG: response regulator [Candidatus Sericytochromatia bacterium]
MAKILAIDDEERMLELICAFLEHDDHEVKTATNGQLALEIAHQFQPELILCDVQMPEMDGYAVLKAFREDEQLVRVPFVFLTGLDDMKHLRQGMNLGADDYLTKPFSYADLSEAIRVRLGKHKALSDQYAAELKEAEEKAEQARNIDDVTGLPNRKRLNEIFTSKVMASGSLALLSCSFDQFQTLVQDRPEALINVLLKGASTRLCSLYPGEDVLFYVDRNHFVLLLPNEGTPLPLRAQTLLGKLNDPYKIMQQELLLTASIGIARCPEDGEDLAGLLRKAEAARTRAERDGGNLHRFAE